MELELDGKAEVVPGQSGEVILPDFMTMLCQEDLAQVATSGEERIIAAGRDPKDDHIVVVTNSGRFFGFRTDVAGDVFPTFQGLAIRIGELTFTFNTVIKKALPLTL